MVQPVRQLGGEHAGAVVVGHVGTGRARRQAVQVDEVAHPVGLRVGQLRHEAPALGVAYDRGGPAGDARHHRDGVAEVGVPGVEGGVVAVAVAPLVPGHHPPALGGQERRQEVERAGEVEPAVGHEERRTLLVAPLVGGDAEPVGIDPPGAIGWRGTGVVEAVGALERGVGARPSRHPTRRLGRPGKGDDGGYAGPIAVAVEGAGHGTGWARVRLGVVPGSSAAGGGAARRHAGQVRRRRAVTRRCRRYRRSPRPPRRPPPSLRTTTWCRATRWRPSP